MSENQGNQTIIANGQLVKGLSFFREDVDLQKTNDNAQSKIDVSLSVNFKTLSQDVYEVTLETIIKATNSDKEIFNLELDYAGIFTIKNFNKEQQEQILNIHCPTMLFPFARRVLADVTRDGLFPPLMLEPVDFANLYKQKLDQQQAIKN